MGTTEGAFVCFLCNPKWNGIRVGWAVIGYTLCCRSFWLCMWIAPSGVGGQDLTYFVASLTTHGHWTTHAKTNISKVFMESILNDVCQCVAHCPAELFSSPFRARNPGRSSDSNSPHNLESVGQTWGPGAYTPRDKRSMVKLIFFWFSRWRN